MQNVLCLNCQEPYVDRVIGGNRPFSPERIDFMNRCLDASFTSLCDRCGRGKWTNLKGAIDEEIHSLTKYLEKNIDAIPTITAHSPQGWTYAVIGLVTGQSTIGTGFLAEFKSSITDLFGLQSNTYNSKIKNGERSSLTQLRLQTLEQGANAVIALDVDYTELGAEKGMIMVCMSGTSVRLDPKCLTPERQERLEHLDKNNRLLRELVAHKP